MEVTKWVPSGAKMGRVFTFLEIITCLLSSFIRISTVVAEKSRIEFCRI